MLNPLYIWSIGNHLWGLQDTERYLRIYIILNQVRVYSPWLFRYGFKSFYICRVCAYPPFIHALEKIIRIYIFVGLAFSSQSFSFSAHAYVLEICGTFVPCFQPLCLSIFSSDHWENYGHTCFSWLGILSLVFFLTRPGLCRLYLSWFFKYAVNFFNISTVCPYLYFLQAI